MFKTLATLVALVALVALVVVGCAVPTDGGAPPPHGYDWALALARAVADEWNPDAVITLVVAEGLDRSGQLTLTHYLQPWWAFDFSGDIEYMEVLVDFDGNAGGMLFDDPTPPPEIPNLDADHLAAWLATALDIFEAHLGDDGFYTYTLRIEWETDRPEGDMHVCRVWCCDDTGRLGYVDIDPATGEVLGHTWD